MTLAVSRHHVVVRLTVKELRVSNIHERELLYHTFLRLSP